MWAAAECTATMIGANFSSSPCERLKPGPCRSCGVCRRSSARWCGSRRRRRPPPPPTSTPVAQVPPHTRRPQSRRDCTLSNSSAVYSKVRSHTQTPVSHSGCQPLKRRNTVKVTFPCRPQVGAAAAVFASRQAALRALRELHRAQLQVEVESEAQVKPWTLN